MLNCVPAPLSAECDNHNSIIACTRLSYHTLGARTPKFQYWGPVNLIGTPQPVTFNLKRT